METETALKRDGTENYASGRIVCFIVPADLVIRHTVHIHTETDKISID